MWKLIWKDSFHYDSSNSALTFIPMIYVAYMNLLLFDKHSEYDYIFSLSFLLILAILTIFPLKLAKGLYLCPLTEAERKKYLMTACFLRLGIMMFLFGLILLVFRFFFEANNFILLLQFILTGIILLGGILISLFPGSYSMDMAKQKYDIAQKLPVPKKAKVGKEERKTAIYSNVLLITTIILAWVGVLLPMNDKEFNMLLGLYYIPSSLVTIACLMVYFTRYFDEVITINVNREVYHYLGKKKAGAFHAD